MLQFSSRPPSPPCSIPLCQIRFATIAAVAPPPAHPDHPAARHHPPATHHRSNRTGPVARPLHPGPRFALQASAAAV